jgi:hypothetical protein
MNGMPEKEGCEVAGVTAVAVFLWNIPNRSL